MPERMRHQTITLLAAIGLLALGTQPAAATDPAGDSGCAVRAVAGDGGRLWVDGGWRPLAPGPIPAGEPKIVTGDARAEIACADGTVLTIAPGAEVNLESLAGPAGARPSVVVQLIEGLIGIIAPSGAFERFDVRTPLAIASVRSTEWAVQHGAEGSAVFVRAGEVAVAATAGWRARLGPGEGIDIAPETARSPSPVRRWGEARVARLSEALGFGWQ